ncbi:hypothetical protein BJX70DRAFT_1277 [Aspergillus crustosus]
MKRKKNRLTTTNLLRKVTSEMFSTSHYGSASPTFREVLTVYFPANLPEKTISALETLLPECIGTFSYEILDPTHPISGFTFRRHGWLEGETTYEGQPTCRHTYFFSWRDLEGQRLYKEGYLQRQKSRVWVGKYLKKAWEVFIDDLEYYGALGMEVENVKMKDCCARGEEAPKSIYNGPDQFPILVESACPGGGGADFSWYHDSDPDL